MNSDPVTVKVDTLASRLPQGSLSTIRILIQGEIEELGQDQNGMVTRLGSYRTANVYHIDLQPHCFTPRHISQLLNRHIAEEQFCQLLSQRIALDCDFISGSFLLSVHVLLIKKVRFLLPSSVTVLSRAASDDVIQRLVNEQRVESIGVTEEEGEEPTSCSICMENLSEESSHENIIKMPECLHMFHQGCIFEWLKRLNSFPLCRRVPYDDDCHEG